MPEAIQIKDMAKTIGGDGVFVIAEIGKNFIQTEEDRPVGEYLDNARVLVDEAFAAGADAVKFQTHEVEDEIVPVNFTSPHFRAKGSDRLSWVSRNSRATPVEEFWEPLIAHCNERGIMFISTPMSRGAARKLDRIGVPLWKVGSADVQDYAMLDFITSTGLPIIISSGMVSLSELDEVVDYIGSKKCPLAILYCISKYPAPPESFNLSSIEHFKERYPAAVVGFSDHSISPELPLGAAKMGAKVIEKHFTLSRDLWGPDHKASAVPEEFARFVRDVRGGRYADVDVSKYYGQKDRELDGANNEFRPYFNKALVAGRDISAGTLITTEMIYAMRPKMHIEGLDANKFYEAMGKKTTKDIKKYEAIKYENLTVN
jgi:N,N'-diacetyllegionaminate synthase